MGSSCPTVLSKALSPTALTTQDADNIWGELPEKADPALAEAYSCEILHTHKGLLRGSWGYFHADAFFRPLLHTAGGITNAEAAVMLIRNILLLALEIERYAEREGETLKEVDVLGEGSYAKVFGLDHVAAKVISNRERQWVHKAAVQNSVEADRLGLGPRIFGHGRVQQNLGGRFEGTVIFMERLKASEDWCEDDTQRLLEQVRLLAKFAFHNDLKLPNVLHRRRGEPVLIDFDLMSQWTVKVAVTTSCIEHNFQSVLEAAGDQASQNFREYYDLFSFSLTLQDTSLYRAVLQRLKVLWIDLEGPVLKKLVDSTSKAVLEEVPFEVMVRVPLQGVSVNLLDLRGNLYVHIAAPAASSIPEDCLDLPQLLRSNGVYWP